MDIELLAPVGSWESLVAAVQSGADAVYLGGKLFSARQYATNFDEEELKKAVNYCHIRDVKVFVTVNTLLSNKELKELGKYIAFLYHIDVDALIVQDLGVAKLVRDLFPDFELHASTQMSVHNFEGVKLLEEMGFKRVVLAREMSKEEIALVKKNTKTDIEVFVHGALCISYSGQCLMSSMIGGRSGNRGRCAQPCRKTYDLVDMSTEKKIAHDFGNYLLSPRDLNTLEDINEILDTGVKSLKIEGRMKRPEYVATVVSAYRKAVDQYILSKKKPQIDEKTLKEVKQMFNRRFTKGYILGEKGQNLMSFSKPSNRGIKIGKVLEYDQHKRRVKIRLEENLSKGDGLEIWAKKGDNPGCIVEYILRKGEKTDRARKGEIVEINFKHVVYKDSLVYKTSDSELLKKAKETYERKDKNIPIYGQFHGKLDKEIELLLWDDKENFVHEKGDIKAEKALKTPTTEERIYGQISKLGSTPYELKKIDIQVDEGVAIPISAINQLRRTAIEKLSDLRGNYHHRNNIDVKSFHEKIEKWFMFKEKQKEKEMHIHVSVNNLNQLKAVLDFSVDRIYYNDFDTIEEAINLGKNYHIPLFPSFSRITEDKELKTIKEKLKKLQIQGILASNLGVLNIAKELGDICIVTDFSLNIFNNGAMEYLKETKVKEVTLSPELTLKDIKEITKKSLLPCEAIIHGNLPLMISKYCPVSTILKNNQNHCGACERNQFGLKDPLGVVFPMVRESNCKVQILNAQKLCLIEHMKELMGSGCNDFRINFTTEDTKEIEETLNAYIQEMKNTKEGNKKDKGVQQFIKKMKENGLTKGHFFRGVM
ncbi:DUF3656 domain-containing U32 family peptidase [Crassaminicella profunda]|uniref:DUF3656 domain-containing U32 family peptidase n=1 Tax=Crassaminicella profunda TaxID=1286698 RepID=UPI001CA69582|nr:U32 family peptidase [Crassaminicella profunda]QZY56330.1 DUF3656 domain-containing protein [Crassaminicella profunda]